MVKTGVKRLSALRGQSKIHAAIMLDGKGYTR